MIYETKLDYSFPTRQLLIDVYTSLYKLDNNGKDGGILIREEIASKITLVYFHNKEDYFLQINLRKKKWVYCSSYTPHNDYISSYIDSTGKTVYFLSHNYENFLMIGCFHV